MRVFLLCSFLLVFIQSSIAQFAALEDSVFLYRKATFSATTDSTRQFNNQGAISCLKQLLSNSESFSYSFSKLNNLSVLNSSDNKFRIFTWNVQWDDYTHSNYGLIQINTNKLKNYPAYIELAENDSIENDWENALAGHENWFGAVYYKVIPFGKKKDNSYVLLGFKGKDRLISQKIIEVLTFSSKGVVLGKSVFEHGQNLKKRVVFSFPSSLTFPLKYNEEDKEIFFDRLAPIEPAYSGNYAFYSTQFIFDAYKLEKDRWKLVLDVDARMPERKKFIPVPDPNAPPGQAKKQ